MAGPNKTYPSIRGLVGLSLHLGNTTAAKRLEHISKNKVTVPRGANHYSLVRKKNKMNKWLNFVCEVLIFLFIYPFLFFGGVGRGCFY